MYEEPWSGCFGGESEYRNPSYCGTPLIVEACLGSRTLSGRWRPTCSRPIVTPHPPVSYTSYCGGVPRQQDFEWAVEADVLTPHSDTPPSCFVHLLLWCTSYCGGDLLLWYTSYCGAPLIVVHLLLWCTSYCGAPLIVVHLLLWHTSYCGTPLIVVHLILPHL